MSEQLRDALAAEVDGAAIVTNYIVIMTVLTEEGGEVHTISDCDHAWQVLGLLTHATEVAKRDKYYPDRGADQ